VSPVRYELGFYIPEDGILHSHGHFHVYKYAAWLLTFATQTLQRRYSGATQTLHRRYSGATQALQRRYSGVPGGSPLLDTFTNISLGTFQLYDTYS
jgi:hypothetical protein